MHRRGELRAAGDAQDSVWRQAVTAAGTGGMAALAAERYLEPISADPGPRRVAPIATGGGGRP